MKKILLIAPASYPVSGAEAIVNIKLLKALSDSGEFQIDLVSRSFIAINYPSGDLESYGVKLNSLHIISVDNKITLKTLWQHFANLLFLGVTHKGCHWGYASLSTVKRLLRENSYDYVVTKGEVALPLGRYVQKHGVKWIATWNDPCPSSMYPAPYGRGIDYEGTFSDRILIKMMQKADKHIIPSKRLATYMQSLIKAKPEDVVIIPHVVLESNRTQRCSNDCLKLIHSGNLMSPRDPRTFLRGLKMFIQETPDAKILFHVLGGLDAEAVEFIKEMNLSDYVQYIKPVEYHKSLELLNDYHISVIIEADCEEGIYLPTKVSDFMQKQIPIFSVSPKNGTLSDLHHKGNIPYFADVQSPESIAKTLTEIYKDFKCNNIKNNIIPSDYLPHNIVNQYLKF